MFIYDGFPGGVGIANKGFDLLGDLLRTTYGAARDYPCKDGCLRCIQSPRCGNNNEPLNKGAAVVILGELFKRK
mgnify:FL=1